MMGEPEERMPWWMMLFIAVMATILSWCAISVVRELSMTDEEVRARDERRIKQRTFEVTLSDGTKCVVYRGRMTCPAR